MEIKYAVITKIIKWKKCLVSEVVYNTGHGDPATALKFGDCAAALEALGVDSNEELGYIHIPKFSMGDILICKDGFILTTEEPLKILDSNVTYKVFDDIEKAIECANELKEDDYVLTPI